MKISLYAMIMPRLEVFFLEEWIEHQLKLGIDKIYLYDNGNTPSGDRGGSSPILKNLRRLTSDERGVKWGKKPNADYFLEYTEIQIHETLLEIVAQFADNVKLQPWVAGVDHKFSGYMDQQLSGYRHCIENNSSDWWITMDPDEYLFSKKYGDVKEFLTKCEKQKKYAVRLSQRVFDARVRGMSVREIFNYGYNHINLTKTFVKTPVDLSSVAVHKMDSKLGFAKRVPIKEFRFNHYRGPPTEIGGEAHSKFADAKFDKIDTDMRKYLNIESGSFE